MLRRIVPVAVAALALAACSAQDKSPKKNGPAVAKGNGITVTAEEFKARLDEQSPFIRARYTTLERSVEGLTGGKPVPLPTFEGRINEKLFLPMTQGAVAGLLTFDDAEPPAADEGEGGEA